MTKKAFIWDFDGTLVDSYDAIMEVLNLLYSEQNWPFDGPVISHQILETSIGQLLDQQAQVYGLDTRLLKARFMAEQEARDDQITLMPYAEEVLSQTVERGVCHFIYTHKGETTGAVLERLGIASYFTQVVTAADGFARKPDPEAVNYLIDQYDLDRAKTYYIGDRPLDRDCALAAGITSINLALPDSPGNIKIEGLLDILDLPIWKENAKINHGKNI